MMINAAYRFPIIIRMAAVCFLLPAALGRAETAPVVEWPVAQFNPNPLNDDLIVPLPCGGAMAFRPVKTGKPPADAGRLSPELQRLYKVQGRFRPFGLESGHLLMGKYEVTRLQYQSVSAVARRGKCPQLDVQSALPQADVNHYEAEGFCHELSQWLADRVDHIPDCITTETPCLPRIDGVPATVRLPGEDEWLLAARGGLAVDTEQFSATRYPIPQGVARSIIGKRDGGGSAAAPIGGQRANPLGLYDMLGNVEEIMLDLYRDEDAPGEIGGYMVRGGSFYSETIEITLALRREVPLLNRTSDTGFRVVASVPVYTSRKRLSRSREAMVDSQTQGTGPQAAKPDAVVSADQYWTRASEMFQAKDWVRLEVIASEWITAYPRDVRAYGALALALDSLGQSEKARQVLALAEKIKATAKAKNIPDRRDTSEK